MYIGSINRQFKEFVRHDNMSFGICAKRKPVNVTTKEYRSLSQHSPVTHVNQSVQQHCRHLCQQIGYTCDGGSLTAQKKRAIPISGLCVHSPDIQLHFQKSFVFYRHF